MAGPERRGGPGILTQHATHAAAILAPSRAARRPLPGQALRASTLRTRDLRAPAPRPEGLLGHAHENALGPGVRRVNSARKNGRVLVPKCAHPSRDCLQVTPCPLAVTSCGHKMAPKYPLLLCYEFRFFTTLNKNFHVLVINTCIYSTFLHVPTEFYSGPATLAGTLSGPESRNYSRLEKIFEWSPTIKKNENSKRHS